MHGVVLDNIELQQIMTGNFGWTSREAESMLLLRPLLTSCLVSKLREGKQWLAKGDWLHVTHAFS